MGNSSLKASYRNDYGYAGVYVDTNNTVVELITSQAWAASQSNGTPVSNSTATAWIVKSGWVSKIYISQTGINQMVEVDLVDSTGNHLYVPLSLGYQSGLTISDFQNDTATAHQCLTQFTFSTVPSSTLKTVTAVTLSQIPTPVTTSLSAGFNGILNNSSLKYLRGVYKKASTSNYYLFIAPPAQTAAPNDVQLSSISTTSPDTVCSKIAVNRTTSNVGVVLYSYSFYPLGSSLTSTITLQNVTYAGDLVTSFQSPINPTNSMITGMTWWFLPNTNLTDTTNTDSLLVACTYSPVSGSSNTSTDTGTGTTSSDDPDSTLDNLVDFIKTPIGIGIVVLLCVLLLGGIYYFATKDNQTLVK